MGRRVVMHRGLLLLLCCGLPTAHPLHPQPRLQSVSTSLSSPGPPMRNGVAARVAAIAHTEDHHLRCCQQNARNCSRGPLMQQRRRSARCKAVRIRNRNTVRNTCLSDNRLTEDKASLVTGSCESRGPGTRGRGNRLVNYILLKNFINITVY